MYILIYNLFFSFVIPFILMFFLPGMMVVKVINKKCLSLLSKIAVSLLVMMIHFQGTTFIVKTIAPAFSFYLFQLIGSCAIVLLVFLEYALCTLMVGLIERFLPSIHVMG